MAEQRGAAGMPPRSLAIAVMCALALASGMGGVAIDRILLRERVAKSILPDTGFHPLSAILRAPTPEDRRQVRSQLADELSLTPTQTIVVDSILDAHTREFDALREGIRPEVERLHRQRPHRCRTRTYARAARPISAPAGPRKRSGARHKSRLSLMRLAVFLAAIALASCVNAPPSISGAPAAPPAPDAYWTPPRGQGLTPAEAPGVPAVAAPLAQAALQHLSLADAVDFALKNNPVTQISWAQARAAAELYGSSRGALFPDLSLSAVATKERQPNVADHTQFAPSVSLTYLLFDFGGRSGSIEAARQTAIAADLTHNTTVQNTILLVESSVFNFLGTRAQRDAERVTLDEATTNLASAEERHRVGFATIADVLQAQTARAQEQLNLESLDGQLQVARGSLAAAMGLPANANFEVPDMPAPDSTSVRSVSQSVDTLIDVAVRNRPDLAAAHAQAEQASAQLRVARSAAFPSLGFSGNSGYANSNMPVYAGRNYTLNFGVSIPVFNGFSYQYDVRAATEQLNAANARTAATRQQIILDVFTSYYALQTAAERVHTSTDLLASASESERVARGRYTEGVGSIVDLLIAQSALASARAQAVAASWQWRTSLAQLAHDAGILGIHGESPIPLGTAGPGSNR